MDEPVGLVLQFLRQHNFEKAEEALRLEFYARHSSTTYSDRHIKVDVASHDADVTARTDCQGKEPLPQISSMKSKFDCSEKSGMVDKKMHAYAEWEFKSCSNDDCVLEFKKQDPHLRRLSQEGSSSNDLDLRQNVVKPQNSIHQLNFEGKNLACFQKPTGFPGSLRNGTAIGQRLSKKEQHNFKMSDHTLDMNALGKIRQDLDAFELKSCPVDDEPHLALQTSMHDGKALVSLSDDQNVTSSMYHSFSDKNWLEHDAAKFLECRESSLQLLPVSKDFEELEEKQVVHDCIDYIKALALEDQMKPPRFLNDMSLPLGISLETQYVDGEFLNERQIEDSLNVNSSCLRTSTGSFSIATGTIERFGIDEMHTNVLFEPAFNIGAFLDIPVGQELSSPGESREDGMFQLCCPQNSSGDTPELLSGFATLGGEPTDPGMGYTQDLWDSDMYEDDEDPGYERQEVEDEDWFLAHETLNTNDKIDIIEKNMGEDILSQSNEKNEICHGKEDLSCFSREVLRMEISDLSQAKSGFHISDITSSLGQLTPSNASILNQVGSLRYDGHLMDAEELKLMRDENIWQSFSSQFHEHLHDDGVKVNDADNNLFHDHVSETESSSDGQSKKNTKQCDLKRDFLHEFDGCIGSAAYAAESIGSIDGISNNSKLDFISPALKQARQHSNLSIGGDVSCCSDPLDLNSIDISRPIIMGCRRSTTANNQGITGECSPWTVEPALLSEEKSIENPKHALLHKQANEILPALENGIGSNPVLLLHSKDQNHVSFPDDFHEGRRDTTTVPDDYDSAVNEVPMDDGEISLEQGEAQLLKTEEDEYEVFSLRIIHRKNRTGFEEEKHFQVILNSVVAGRYLITEYLGSAAFSKAVQARDLQTGMDVCMKIIKNNKDFFDQSLDEIKLLKYINKNDPSDKHHLLRLYDYFYHREHLFIVCELLRANLYEFHKFNKESGGEPYFTMPRLQSITRQCLEALEFLHCLGLIHCDLKPENILIKSYSQCEIKVIDLGSSCFQTDHLCSYVQSRSYRAPEVILGLPYNEKIDIWSLGCILAELCSGNVLFQNDSLATLLARVIGIIEPIVGNMILDGKESHKYFTKNSMLYERNQDTNKLEYLIPKKSSLRHRLRSGDQGFVDFVGYLLQVNPESRPSASEALKHPWLTHPYDGLCK